MNRTLLSCSFLLCSFSLLSQIVDCLPTPRSLKTELLLGQVRSVWEREMLADSSIWEERYYEYNADGYLIKEQSWDTSRHLQHTRQVLYTYNENYQLTSRKESEYQLAKGGAPLLQHEHSIHYTYDKHGRFFLEQDFDSHGLDTLYYQYMYLAGGWINICPVLNLQTMRYDARNPLATYRYNHNVCVERVDYTFDDHTRHQLLLYDAQSRLSGEDWYYKNTKQAKDTLARFLLQYDYPADKPYPSELRLLRYFQKTAYYDALPMPRKYEYSEVDAKGNWQKCAIRYINQMAHLVQRKLVYW